MNAIIVMIPEVLSIEPKLSVGKISEILRVKRKDFFPVAPNLVVSKNVRDGPTMAQENNKMELEILYKWNARTEKVEYLQR